MKKIYLIIILMLIIFINGCVNELSLLDIDNKIRNNKEIQDFLLTYPNSELKVVYLIKDQMKEIIPNIKEECGNIEIKDYYQLSVKDLIGTSSINFWIDIEGGEIVCITKKGISNEVTLIVKEIIPNLNNLTIENDTYEVVINNKNYKISSSRGVYRISVDDDNYNLTIENDTYEITGDNETYNVTIGNDTSEIIVGNDTYEVDMDGEAEIPQNCFDSDNGQNYYIQGIITDENGTIKEEDICDDKNILIEWYCYEDSEKFYIYYCLNGCKKGYCETED